VRESWDDLIIETVSRLLVPFVQTYALYVLAHGHSSPGGGFQGGCAFAASLILLALVWSPKGLKKRMPEKALLSSSALGVGLFYAGLGALCMAFGGSFLDYAALDPLLPKGKVMARYYGMALVETGVQFTVMSVMALIFLRLLEGEGGCSSSS